MIVSDQKAKTPVVTETTYSENKIQAHVRGKTLVLRGAWLPYPGLKQEPVVTVRTADVERITLAGPTDMSGKDVHSTSGIHLFSMGFGKVNFTGKAVLMDYIRQVGRAQINIRWVDSKVLRMDFSGGTVHLAGVANQVYARVMSYAKLDAIYLRANDLSIQTADRAVARVSSNDNMNAFASGFSNVFYYKHPAHITTGTSQSGNVLQMAWHN